MTFPVVNAYSLYVATTRYVLGAELEDVTVPTELGRLLPFLRQALSCSVCGGVLCEPMGTVDQTCLHHVCRRCLGGRMLRKPSCSWCKDYALFVDNQQLRILVQCFKSLCGLLAASAGLMDRLHVAHTELLAVIQEGLAVTDTFSLHDDDVLRTLAVLQPLPPAPPSGSDSDEAELPEPLHTPGRQRRASCDVTPVRHVSSQPDESPPACDVTADHHYVSQLRADLDECLYQVADADAEDDSETSEASDSAGFEAVLRLRRRQLQLQAARARRRGGRRGRRAVHRLRLSGCSCGQATPTPGRLTCFGQRCPCYSAFRGCVNCGCRGCRNPRKTPPAPGLDDVAAHVDVRSDL